MRRISVPPRRSKVRSCRTRRSLPGASRKGCDFVEDNGAAAAKFEAAQLALDRAGEAPRS